MNLKVDSFKVRSAYMVGLLSIAVLIVMGLFWFIYSRSRASLLVSGFICFAVLVGAVLYWGPFGRTSRAIFIYAYALVCSGLLYCLVFVPFSVPDETYHFESAYGWSNIIMGFGSQDGDLLMREQDVELINAARVRVDRDNYRSTISGLLAPSGSSELVESHINFKLDPAANPPQVRLFTSLGIVLARLLNLNSYLLFYLGRLFGFIAFVVMALFAYRLTPVAKSGFAVTSLLPMTLHLAASYSYDSPIIGMALLLTALCLRAIYRTDKLKLTESVVIALLIFLIAPCKLIYSVIGLLTLFIPSRRFVSKKIEMTVKLCCILMIVVGVFVLRFASIAQIAVASSGGNKIVMRGDEPGSLYTVADVLNAPGKFAYMLIQTVELKGSQWARDLVGGSLGWFQVEIASPWFFNVAMYLVLVASFFRAEEDHLVLPGIQRTTCLVLAAVGCLGAICSMLFGWTFNTEQVIEGVQGRYFLPLLPMAMVGLRSSMFNIRGSSILMFVSCVSVLNAFNLIRIFSTAICLI